MCFIAMAPEPFAATSAQTGGVARADVDDIGRKEKEKNAVVILGPSPSW
jgi:hypothetical protein